ncbi:MAG: serine/threonine protein kinase [Bradyrhizobiaceae bacterium]|nr:serine/threonine protein kinase [Bradyrhizobiaceae bacterium]
MTVPDALAGRWQTTVVLKRDVFSTVERGTFRGDDGAEVPGVLRRLDEVPWWSRPVARHLFNRERRALARAGRLAVAPPLIYADDRRLVRGYIPGSALKIARPFGDYGYFRSARAALRALHRAGISHNDLAKEQNWLRSPDGRAYLLDFQLAWVFSRRNWLFRVAAYEDLRHFLKHKRRYIPDAVTPAEHRMLAKKSLPTRIWMATGKKLYLLVTRGLLGFIDSEGSGPRMAYDAPKIEAALRALAEVRDVAVLDFPNRRNATGLYAFVETDAPLAEDEVRSQLVAAVGPDKLPEFIQVADALPRAADGNLRRDILRLISTNQIDLIEPLITSAQERRITDRLVAERKNLYGALDVVAALTACPGVRDVAVLAYPDRRTGTGLYAFVEAGGGEGVSPDLSEDRLAAHVADAIGRDNAPNFIQIVPALPREGTGQDSRTKVRTDILQLIAMNQVENIGELIASDALRAVVEPILNGRHNMRDRFVL